MSSEGENGEVSSPVKKDIITKSLQEKAKQSDDEDEEPPPISSDQLLRRASFKKILEDLSTSADAINKPAVTDPLVSAAAATAQAQAAQQAAILQQAGLTNPALIPLLQNLQQSAVAAASNPSNDLTQHLAAAAMMLPGQLNAQQQLTAAILNSQSGNTTSPLIANVASLAGHNTLQLPTNLLSSALLNASSSNPLSNFSAQLAAAGGSPLTSVASLGKSPLRTDTSLSTGSLSTPEDTTKKREVRLMKNREAARECRRKKKEYIRCLENRVAVLESQNQALIGELRALKELYLPKNQE